MTRQYFIAILLVAGLLSAACTPVVRFYHGRVVDENGSPLQGVAVREMHGRRSVATDAGGYFRLKKDPVIIEDLVFNKEGYRQDTILTVFTHAGESVDYNFLGKDTTEVALKPDTAP